MDDEKGYLQAIAEVCRPGDPRLAQVWDQRGGWEARPDGGPALIVIGVLTTDQQLEGMARRFGVDLARLLDCREQLRSESDTDSPAARHARG